MKKRELFELITFLITADFNIFRLTVVHRADSHGKEKSKLNVKMS